jgi:hypothetical protein
MLGRLDASEWNRPRNVLWPSSVTLYWIDSLSCLAAGLEMSHSARMRRNAVRAMRVPALSLGPVELSWDMLPHRYTGSSSPNLHDWSPGIESLNVVCFCFAAVEVKKEL